MGIFDRYRKVGLLGQGGMGQVFLAFDPVLERYVAIKQIGQSILEHPENATLLAYFEREAKVVAALQHPNIIQIYEFARPATEPAYIVTEFVDGLTLEELVEARPGLPAAAVLPLLLPVAEALEYAHDRDIVHRDLKPGNIMLSRHGRVYLMDFGLAKPLGASGLKSMVIGSPSFMAPEQIEGKETDRRADIFSFGLLVWALTTGELFFSAEAPRAFVEILTDTYPKPEQLARLGDPALATIVSMCLRRDLSQRAGSMSEVIAVMERAIAGLRLPSPARENRRLAEGWLDLMPQQYTPGVPGAVSHDTSPADAVALGVDLVASDRYEAEEPPESAGASAAPRRGQLLVAREVSDEDLPAVHVIEEEPSLQRRSPDELVTRVEAHAEATAHGDRAFHSAETVVVAVDAVSPDELSSTAPRIPLVAAAPSPGDLPTSPTLRVAPDDRTRRRLFIPTAPVDVHPRAGSMEVTADLDDEVVDRLEALNRPGLCRRLLWFAAAYGGELKFPVLREWLGDVALAETNAVPEALAQLVDAEVLERRGDEAIGTHGDIKATDLLVRLGRDASVARIRGVVLTRFLTEANDARERCDTPEAEDWLRRAAVVARCDAYAPVALVSDVFIGLAELALMSGQLEEARAQLDDAFGLRGQGAREGARVRLAYAGLYAREGRGERARDALLDAAAGAVEIGDQTLERLAQLTLIELDLSDGELRRGRGRLAELARKPALSEPALAVRRQLAAAELALWLDGDPSGAAALLELVLERGGSDIALEGAAQLLLGRVLREDGRLSAAQDRVEQARATARALGLVGLEADALIAAAGVAREVGRPAEAVRHARRAVSLSETLRDARRAGRARTELAFALLAEGEVEAARSAGEEARAALLPFRFDRLAAELALTAVEAVVGGRSAALPRLERLAAELQARGIVWPLAQRALRPDALALYPKHAPGLRDALDSQLIAAWGLA